jgi:dethiobiotin synthetase
MRRAFVTGTDTDVGKTQVTAVLARAARSQGSVLAAKPVASGGAHLGPGEDALRLAAAGGHPPLQFAGYQAPLSPHRAAALEGAQLDVPGLIRWVDALQADTVLVEGAGGWRVPLTPGFDIADLARAWGAPVLVVAADRLGVLNHTRLTVDAVRASGCAVAGVVLNRLAPDASSAWNEADLRACLDVPVAVLPPCDLADDSATIALGLAIWGQIG